MARHPKFSNSSTFRTQELVYSPKPAHATTLPLSFTNSIGSQSSSLQTKPSTIRPLATWPPLLSTTQNQVVDLGGRAFSIAVPTLWKFLSKPIRDCSDLPPSNLFSKPISFHLLLFVPFSQLWHCIGADMCVFSQLNLLMASGTCWSNVWDPPMVKASLQLAPLPGCRGKLRCDTEAIPSPPLQRKWVVPGKRCLPRCHNV